LQNIANKGSVGLITPLAALSRCGFCIASRISTRDGVNTTDDFPIGFSCFNVAVFWLIKTHLLVLEGLRF